MLLRFLVLILILQFGLRSIYNKLHGAIGEEHRLGRGIQEGQGDEHAKENARNFLDQ